MPPESRQISTWIDRRAADVYDFASDPNNLPMWAPGLGTSVENVDGRWFVQTESGRVGFAFVEHNRHGVLDHEVTLPSGEVIYNPMRVVPHGDGCEVVFSLRRSPHMSDEGFARDAGLVQADLKRLKHVLETHVASKEPPAAPSRADPQPILVPPGAGRVLDFLSVTHRLTSEQSEGSIYIFESAFEPGDGNRLHVHRREDEIAYVLEGALEVRLTDRTEILEAGGVGRLPRNLPHAIRNPLDTRSRYLFLAVPGGLDRWFDAVAEAQAAGTLDEALFRTLSEDRGIRWLE